MEDMSKPILPIACLKKKKRKEKKDELYGRVNVEAKNQEFSC
jgi:hypothetical protein